jgi:hypothetical protein
MHLTGRQGRNRRLVLSGAHRSNQSAQRHISSPGPCCRSSIAAKAWRPPLEVLARCISGTWHFDWRLCDFNGRGETSPPVVQRLLSLALYLPFRRCHESNNLLCKSAPNIRGIMHTKLHIFVPTRPATLKALETRFMILFRRRNVLADIS